MTLFRHGVASGGVTSEGEGKDSAVTEKEAKPDACPGCGTPIGSEDVCPTCGRKLGEETGDVELQRETKHEQDPQAGTASDEATPNG